MGAQPWTDTLAEEFILVGWSEKPEDFCWMACDKPGYLQKAGKYEICLCREHLEEIEKTAARYGYVGALPPEEGGYWPWQLTAEAERQKGLQTTE